MKTISYPIEFVVFIVLCLSSCLQKTYPGPSHGAQNVAKLLIYEGQAERIDVTVNGEKIDGPPYRVSALPGQTSVKLRYHIKKDQAGTVFKRFGECELNFNSVAAQLYEVRFGLLTAGSATEASEATLKVDQLNTWPAIYGSFDKKALAVCKDLGREI